jgi:hypothetical protein
MEAINQEKKKGNGRLRVTPPKKDKEKAADQGNASDVTQPPEEPAQSNPEKLDGTQKDPEEAEVKDGLWGNEKSWTFPTQ